LNWNVVAIATLILLVVRPLSAWISVIGSPEPAREKAVIA
jgi:NhaP-type Na+/H+ or K+/H+ antiporter